jgi:hypothetical protein
MRPTKLVNDGEDAGGTPSIPMLRTVLSPGYDAGQADIDRIFELAEREGDPTDPNLPFMPRLREWLSTLLAAEYFGEEPDRPGKDAPPRTC